MKKKKKILSLLLACIGLCIAALTGCNSIPEIDKVEESTLYISKEGSITAFLVDTFEKSYYDQNELEAMIQEEIKEYGQSVKLSRISSKSMIDTGIDGIIVQMEYADGISYTGFNGKKLFYGTIAEAYEAGYKINVIVKDMSDASKVISESEIKAMSDKHILIVEENIKVSVPSKILYVSGGVSVLKNTEAVVNHETGYSYIIMK